MMTETKRLRLGVVGCGAISNLYLPVLARRKDVELAVVTDLNLPCAYAAKERYHADVCTSDYRELIGRVDGVVLCVPNVFHAPIAIDCLRHGIAVLCEKPMATNMVEAEQMVRAAHEGQTVLAAANVRRFYWSSNEVKRIIETKQFGEILSIDAEEGEPFGWPTASGFFFDRTQSGGGVLIDMGSHLLDLLLWWLDDYPDSLRYYDDNFGGVEADARIEMAAGQTRVSVKLSRLAGLRNRCRLIFRQGTVTVTPEDFDVVRVNIAGPAGGQTTLFKGPVRGSLHTYFVHMIDDFVRSIHHKSRPLVAGDTVLPSIRLIEQCYAAAQHDRVSWLQEEKVHAVSI